MSSMRGSERITKGITGKMLGVWLMLSERNESGVDRFKHRLYIYTAALDTDEGGE